MRHQTAQSKALANQRRASARRLRQDMESLGVMVRATAGSHVDASQAQGEGTLWTDENRAQEVAQELRNRGWRGVQVTRHMVGVRMDRQDGWNVEVR